LDFLAGPRYQIGGRWRKLAASSIRPREQSLELRHSWGSQFCGLFISNVT